MISLEKLVFVAILLLLLVGFIMMLVGQGRMVFDVAVFLGVAVLVAVALLGLP